MGQANSLIVPLESYRLSLHPGVWRLRVRNKSFETVSIAPACLLNTTIVTDWMNHRPDERFTGSGNLTRTRRSL